MGEPLLSPAGLLFDSYGMNLAKHDVPRSEDELEDCLLPKDDDNLTEHVKPPESDFFFIPQVEVHGEAYPRHEDGRRRKRVLVLCTGGTLTMVPDPSKGGALAPLPGAVTDFMKSMLELSNEKMPEVVVHEYNPLLDSSDMGPPDWAVLARDIKEK